MHSIDGIIQFLDVNRPWNSSEIFSWIVSAPGRSADEVLIGQVDIAMRGDDDAGNVVSVDENSIDSHGEETFSKKCYVDNKYYSHSEMVSFLHF